MSVLRNVMVGLVITQALVPRVMLCAMEEPEARGQLVQEVHRELTKWAYAEEMVKSLCTTYRPVYERQGIGSTYFGSCLSDLSSYIAAQDQDVKDLMDRWALSYIETLEQRQQAVIPEGGELNLMTSDGDVNACASDGRTALMVACQEQNVQGVRILLQAKAHVNTEDRDGATALFIAATMGNQELVDHLLERGANPFVVTKLQKRTMLIPAVMSEHVGVVRSLLDAHIDPDRPDCAGLTALDYATHPEIRAMLEQASQAAFVEVQGDEEQSVDQVSCDEFTWHEAGAMVQKMWQAYTDGCLIEGLGVADYLENLLMRVTRKRAAVQKRAGASTVVCESTSFMRAIAESDISWIQNKMAADEWCIHLKDDGGQMPLFHAVQEGRTNVARLFLDARANPNIVRAADGATPLMIACSNGSAPMVSLLLEHGASVTARDTDAHGVLDYVSRPEIRVMLENAMQEKGGAEL